MEKDCLLGLLISKFYPVYESCLQKKMIKLSFMGQGEMATEILALIHTDVCGLFDVQVRGGYV